MANISDKVQQIRQAVHGIEIRESLAQGIESINTEVESTTNKQTLLEAEFDQMIINAGSSNAEIVQARVDAEGNSYTNLQQRFNSVDAYLADIIHINIKNYGAKGDGSNDYDAWVAACVAAGVNGIVYFPKTTANTYWLGKPTGQLSFANTPYILTETPDCKIIANYASDIKNIKALSPFKLNNGSSYIKNIDPIDLQKKIGKVATLVKNPSQVLTKLNFTTDVTPQNFTGTAFNNITGLAVLTADSMKFDLQASGTNLLMRALAQGKYMEAFFEKDAAVPSGGFNAMCIKSDLYAYLCQFSATDYSYTVTRYTLIGGATSIVKSFLLPEQYKLKEGRCVIYGIKNKDNKTFELFVNGYCIDAITLSGETYDKVGIGHSRHLNNQVTISYGLEITNYNNPNYRGLKLWSFGDSITYGAYSFKDYPTMIADILYREKGIKELTVNNLAHSGDTSAVCLDVVNANKNSIGNTDIVTVQIGTNDCQGDIDVNTYITNVTSIIDAITPKTSRLVVASFPVYSTLQPNYGKIALYNARLKQLCISKGVKFVDNMSAFGYNEDLYNDGIHPKEEGMLILAKSFADAIAEMF